MVNDCAWQSLEITSSQTHTFPWTDIKAKARNRELGWDPSFLPTEVSKNILYQGKGVQESQHLIYGSMGCFSGSSKFYVQSVTNT